MTFQLNRKSTDYSKISYSIAFQAYLVSYTKINSKYINNINKTKNNLNKYSRRKHRRMLVKYPDESSLSKFAMKL